MFSACLTDISGTFMYVRTFKQHSRTVAFHNIFSAVPFLRANIKNLPFLSTRLRHLKRYYVLFYRCILKRMNFYRRSEEFIRTFRWALERWQQIPPNWLWECEGNQFDDDFASQTHWYSDPFVERWDTRWMEKNSWITLTCPWWQANGGNFEASFRHSKNSTRMDSQKARS